MCVRISCFMPAAVVVSGNSMSRKRSGIEAENRTVRRRGSAADLGSRVWSGVEQA